MDTQKPFIIKKMTVSNKKQGREQRSTTANIALSLFLISSYHTARNPLFFLS